MRQYAVTDLKQVCVFTLNIFVCIRDLHKPWKPEDTMNTIKRIYLYTQVHEISWIEEKKMHENILLYHVNTLFQ